MVDSLKVKVTDRRLEVLMPDAVVVLDTGNGNLKYMSETQLRGLLDAAIAEFKDSQGQTAFSNRKDATRYRIGEENKEWVIGWDDIEAYKLKITPVSSRNGEGRYNTDGFKTYATIGLANAAAGLPESSKILLITSTPAYDSQNSNIKERLQKILRKTHIVNINGEEKVIKVVKHEMMSETEAVLYDLYLDSDGYEADGDILNQDVLIINIGYGTTDLAYYSKMNYIKLPKETLNTSFKDVYQDCADWLSTYYRKQIDSQEVASQLSRQHTNEAKTFEHFGDVAKGFDAIYKKAVQAVGDKLISELNDMIDDPTRFHRMVVVGGPVSVWGASFKEWNPKKVTVPEDAQFATARGMYKFGKYVILAGQADAESAATNEE